jgi:5-methylcytosine-specific restriction endonuclease McrA
MRAKIAPKLRQRCFDLAGGRCEHCRTALNPKAWECDHVDPHHYTQCHEIENLQALCKPCHALKTKMDVRGIAWVRRMHGETGQLKRRKARGHSLIQGRNTLAKGGLKRKLDGSVVPR